MPFTKIETSLLMAVSMPGHAMVVRLAQMYWLAVIETTCSCENSGWLDLGDPMSVSLR